MGSHPSHQEENQSSWRQRCGNQGRNYEHATDGRNHERGESINSKIESMLEQVLDRVVSTDVGVQELKPPQIQHVLELLGKHCRGGRTPPNRVEDIVEENVEQCYEAMLLDDLLEEVLLNHNSEGIEGFEE
ncbi:hypothetical protein HAX54_018749, partial [Datura stramonium]|nr:hypothetical protein [Datura stramonium]